MRGLAIAVLALTAVTACDSTNDPLEPTASGQVQLGAGVNPSTYTRLAVRMTPVGQPPEAGYRSDVTLPDDFPHRFDLGGHIGVSSYVDFDVRAWLTTEAESNDPRPGEPHASIPVHFTCDGSCVPHDDLVLVLAP